MDQSHDIVAFLLEHVSQHPRNIVNVTAKRFSVTKTTVHRHLNKLITRGKIIKTGRTRDAMYYLANSISRKAKFKISNELQESRVYDDYLHHALSQLPENVEIICHYGFTEIFNNAIDHSHGTNISMVVECINRTIKITITDDGIGIFKKIYDFFKLEDIYESVLQLSKGKMTTCPSRHSGEGLFFSSRAFDTLEIFANNIHYVRNNIENDWTLQSCDTSSFGSKIVMTITIDCKRNLVDIFKYYQDETLDFNRTDILVKLSQLHCEHLISRSQAKRILRGIETRFKLVTLDFSGITAVGQGFVDEIFRVYKNQHPEIKFQYINANQDVEFMIKRGIARVTPRKTEEF